MMLADARSSPTSLLETPRSALASLTFDRFSASLLFLALGCAACLMPAQSDTWWHLRTGQDIWKSGTVQLRDTFSHTVNGGYWPNHEWLSQVLFYGIYGLGGLRLLTACAAALVMATWLIVWRLAPSDPTRRLIIVALAVIPSAMAWSLRPQLFTLFLVAFTAHLLNERRYWGLPVLFVVWANLHGGVVLGIVLLMAAIAHNSLETRRFPTTLVTTSALCIVATALTPLGFSLWTEIPASLARLRQYQVLEWRAPSVRDVSLLPFWVMAGTLVLLALRRPFHPKSRTALDHEGEPRTGRWLVVGALTLLPFAVTSSRNVPAFLLIAVPALLLLFESRFPSPSRRSDRRERPILNVGMLAIAVMASATVVASAWTIQSPRLQWRPMPVETIAAVRACPGRLYNNYDDGGYLIWFVPERTVFLDSRQDPYPPALVQAHIRAELSGEYRALFDRYEIQCALTRTDSPLAARLATDGWRAIHADATWQVFRR
jgi:hypothetical protein